MATVSSSSDEESGEDIVSENVVLGYVLAYRCYLSKAQKKRVMGLVQEIQPQFTAFVSIMRRGNVQPPGPNLGITKEYATAHFPDRSTHITLGTPGKSKKWHPRFYRRDVSRNYMVTGEWLDFVRDNHVQEGDICLLLPTRDDVMRRTFTVYVLHETSHYSAGGPGASSVAKMASEIRTEEEPAAAAGESVSSGTSGAQEFPHGSAVESGGDSGDSFEPPYFVPCKSPLSESQKRIVEERVRAIRSEIPICVAVMKNNNVGFAQRWMLELGSRYGSVYLPTKGQTILLCCAGKTWKAKMMFHNGRRWFLNGGWPNFARGNGLRVGDICLFQLEKNESTLTMAVHIIRREQF
ncbi:B3 domain-containing protein [Zea mays]|nr:B3 domain-containing protein [Zea mays]